MPARGRFPGGCSCASPARACTGRITTAAATTTNGWHGDRRLQRMSCRWSRPCSQRRSTPTCSSACVRCGAGTPISSPPMGDDERLPPDGPASRHGLSAVQAQQLAALLELLEADEHAPSAVRDSERAATTHLADSLAALELAPVGAAEQVADIGSG